MKKIIFLILAIGVIGLLVYITRSNSKPILDIPRPNASDSQTFQPDPSNATFTFEDGPVTLSNSQWKKDAEHVDLVDQVGYTYGDINNDNKNDTAVFLARYGGGSGTFIYLAAFLSGPVGYKGSNAVFLGDRIIPQEISITNGVVVAKYLDRAPDDAFAEEPTIPISRQFLFNDGILEERGG